jgi:hypothetical protein
MTQAPGTDLTVIAGTVVLVGLVNDQSKATGSSRARPRSKA